MDPRHSAQHPFSRPPSHPSIRDSRYPPIPPPPYSSQQPTVRSDSLHGNDPFLRRRNERDDYRTSSPISNQTQPPFALPNTSNYTASALYTPTVLDTQTSRTPYGSGRPERYNPQRQENESQETFQPLQQNHVPPSNPSYNYGIYSTPKRDSGRPAKEVTLRPFESQPLPPPPFSGRPMPPPSSPQGSHSQPNSQSSMLRGPPPPPPPPPPPAPPSSSGGRDIASLPPIHRPGSSMSISSMLGADTSRSTHTTVPASNSSNAPSKIKTKLSSPGWQPSSTSPSQTYDRAAAVYQKSQSPESSNVPLAQSSRPSRAYSVTSGGGSRRSFSGNTADLPGNSTVGLSSGTFVSRFSPTSDSSPRQDWKSTTNRYPSTGRRFERPNSQPSGYSTPPRDSQEKVDDRSAPSELDRFRRTQSDTKIFRSPRTPEGTTDREQVVRTESASTDYRDHRSQRPRDSLPTFGPDRRSSPKQEAASTSSYPFITSRIATASDPPNSRSRPETELSVNRIVDREPYNPSLTQSPFSSESLRRLREQRLVAAAGVQQHGSALGPSNFHSQPTEQAENRQGPMPAGNPQTMILTPSATDNTDQPVRTEEENLQSHRGSLALLFDNNRRGRASPLPQAVQGAQARVSGPASDPGIKSEFARMFIGIGSGVGSAGKIGSGASSPYPPSPTRHLDTERRTPLSGRGELVELTKTGVGSRGGKRGRKPKEEDPKQENENEKSDITAGLSSTRGVKRTRHHHHPHNHPHHHRQVEQSGTPVTANVANSKRISTPTQTAPVAPGHHHHHPHHHHHHPHHHHHHHHNRKAPAAISEAASAGAQVAPSRIPTTTVDSKGLLERAQTQPRRHLGSILYNPSPEIPRVTSSQVSKNGAPSKTKQLPRFEGKENCTITIRIPRYYLTNAEREKICSRRVVWGVDVYTDDSDPLAAAIHSGWIRGEWGESVDASMLESAQSRKPSAEAAGKAKPATTELVHLTRPSEPLKTIGGKDLHLTLLILPTLQSYASHVRHGIKSRAWGNTHDGMSFMIEKVAWVDGGAGKGEERGGEARRKRMKTLAGWQAMAMGPPVRLNMLTPDNTGMKTTAVEG